MPDSTSGAVEQSTGDPAPVDLEARVRALMSSSRRRIAREPDWNGSDRGRLLARMRMCGVDPRYLEASPERLNPAADKSVTAYVANLTEHLKNGVGLYLWGGVGTGKSSAAALVVREIVKDSDKAVVWWSFADLMVALENPFERRDVLRKAQYASVLVLDDFGVQVMSAQYSQWLDQIVDARWRRKKPTIVTTNVDPTGMMNRPEMTRVMDRWRSAMVVVPFSGGSRR